MILRTWWQIEDKYIGPYWEGGVWKCCLFLWHCRTQRRRNGVLVRSRKRLLDTVSAKTAPAAKRAVTRWVRGAKAVVVKR